jgi:6-phosphogluconolactonase
MERTGATTAWLFLPGTRPPAKLTRIENISSGGRTPQIFAIDPTGTYLVVGNEGSDNLTAFRIDRDTSRLKFNSEQVSVPQPTCVKFVSAAQSRKD